MEKTELFSIIDTLKDAEETQRNLDEFVDSHSDCIGTIRRYLLEGIREYVFGRDDTEECLNTIKSINSSLKGLCCSFGHVSFPFGGLGQLFYRILIKVFTIELPVEFNIASTKSECEIIHIKRSRYIEMVKCCIDLLCTILKLLSAENSSLCRDFIDDTLRNIYYFNKITKKNESDMKNILIHDIYDTFINKLACYSGWSNGNEAPIALKFPNNYIWSQFILGRITVSLLRIHAPYFQYSLTRDRFIYAWLNILVSAITKNKRDLFGIHLLVLKTLTNDFKSRIDDSSLHLIDKTGAIEILYGNGTLITSDLHYWDFLLDEYSSIQLVGDFTIWYFDGFQRKYNPNGEFICKMNRISYCYQLEKAFSFWFEMLNFQSQDAAGEYYAFIVYFILNKMPSFTEQIIAKIENKIQKELFTGNYINTTDFCLIMKSKLLVSILNLIDIQSLILKIESNKPGIFETEIDSLVYKIFELCSIEINESNLSIFIANIQMILSKYLTAESLYLDSISTLAFYSISTAFILSESLIKLNFGFSFEFGSYLLNHFCRTVDLTKKDISKWGISQCIFLSELSFRILVKCKDPVDNLIISLLDLEVCDKNVFTSIIWNCITNLLMINCIHSNNINEFVLKRILQELVKLSFDDSSHILLKVMKPLSTIIFRNTNDKICNSILDEAEFIINNIELNNEAFFPFGSSFDSLSYYYHNKSKGKSCSEKKIGFLPNILICSNCNKNITSIPTNGIFICNKCFSIVSTSVDIDNSVFIPEIKDYLSTIDISLRHKNKNDIDDSLIRKLVNKVNDIPRDILNSNYDFFLLVSVNIKLLHNKLKSTTLDFFEFMRLGLFGNNKHVTYLHLKALVILLSKKFILLDQDPLEGTNLLTSELLLPSPIGISNITRELTDPSTNLFSEYENFFRITLLLSRNRSNNIDSSIRHDALSHVLLVCSNEFQDITKFEKKVTRSLTKYESSLSNIFEISKSMVQKLPDTPGLQDFVNIDFNIWNFMFLSATFDEKLFSNLFSLIIHILNKSNIGIEANWKKFWSKEDLTEFLKGIIPGKKYNTINQFRSNSNVTYNLLTILSALLMKQNTTLSSISISPGLKKFISAKCFHYLDLKFHQQPNSVIILFGPAFNYILPNLFYRSLVEFTSNIHILSYIRKFIPSALSHDKLVTLLPYFFLSVLENSEYKKSNKDLVLYFRVKRNDFYSKLLQIDSVESDLELPRTLINTSIAGLFWSETNLDDFICFEVNQLSEESGNTKSPEFNIDEMPLNIKGNKLFIEQCIRLSNIINVLLFESGAISDELKSKNKKLRISPEEFSKSPNDGILENYIGKNLMWFLEFYNKTIFLDKISININSIKHTFFPVSFIVKEPPKPNYCSMYWYRVFRTTSLLLFFSKKYIKKYATRLLELLIRLTHTSGIHPSSIESWEIYISYLFDYTQRNMDFEKDIFLQLLPPIVDQIYLMIETHRDSRFRSYFEKLLEKILFNVLRTNNLYFSLIPVVPNEIGSSIRKIIVSNYYGSQETTKDRNHNDYDSEYNKLLMATFKKRIDLTLKFLSPNVPHITYEKLLGSIKDILTMFPISSYWLLYDEKDMNDTLFRIFQLFEKCTNIVSNASNDSLLIFQKQNISNIESIYCHSNDDIISRYNLIKHGFRNNISLSGILISTKVNYSIEKSISFLKNIIAGIIGSIGAFDINIVNYLNKMNTSQNGKLIDKNSFDDSLLFPSIKKSIFIKELDTIAIELVENHLITYSHWNVAAYAIQETLKYIGCHNSINTEDQFKNWNKFQPEIQEILHPYLSTEYRIIQGTKKHLLSQIKNIDKNTENVYEFYFWCLDQINEELSIVKKKSSSEIKIPDSILNICTLLEGCRLVSLGVPYVLNIILLISIECMILFFDHSKIRVLKSKLCSLVISGLENSKICKSSKNKQQINQHYCSNSVPLQDVTYESIFIVMTHLIELYEHLIQYKVPKTLTWFNESLLEPFLLELYSNDGIRVDTLNNEMNKNSDSSTSIGVISPSSTTLSLLAEATKINSSKETLPQKNNEIGSQSDNELERYIYNQTTERKSYKNIINDKNHLPTNFNPGMKLFSTLTNYPILKIVANLQFITDIPISLLIQAALSCRTYTRALLLFERFLLTKQLNNDYSKKKRKIGKKNLSFISQFGLKINYSGNIIDYLGTTGFTTVHFDPLDPLNFYKTCFNTYINLPNISEREKKSLNTHILYLPFQCYLGINDIENLLGTMSIYEQISAASEGVIGKQLIESFLMEDYLKAATIYESILLNITGRNTIITKCYLRCLIKAGLPKIVLNTLIQSRNKRTIDSNLTESKPSDIISNHSLFISEALEACYTLGSWEYLDTFLSDFNNDNYFNIQNDSSDNDYLNFFIPSNIDVITQKFDIYYGRLLLHLYFLKNNRNEAYLQKNKVCESFKSSLEKTRNLLFTKNNIFWRDSHFTSSNILENLHILMDIEYIYNFISAEINNQLSVQCISSNPLISSEKPLWFSMTELFVNRVDNAQSNYSIKHSILSHAKLGLEISGFDLASFSILLVLEKSKIHFLHKSISYVNFLDSFEIIENGSGMNNQNITCVNNRVPSIIGLTEFNFNKLFLPSFSESVPGIIQINKSITINYFEHILGLRTNTSWTELERKLLDEWEKNDRNIYITSLNRSLAVTYLFKLFQNNQVRKAIHLYELINNTQYLIDSNTLSEINLVYLDWAIKSSTVSPENIINIFKKTVEYRSNCEKTYFQFANYLDSYFHLIISNIETENNIKTNINSNIGNNLGSLIKCDEIILLCIIMYLNCLKCGNMFIYPSLSRVLFLIFNHSNILLKLGALVQPQKIERILADENVNSFPDSLSKIRRELFTLPPSLWYIVLPQLLSRSQHPGLGSFIIQPLVARIIRALPRQAGWFFVSMLKSNCTDRKNTAFEILKISKTLYETNEKFPTVGGDECSLIIDEYTRLFDNLSVLAMDMSTGNVPTSFKGEKSTKSINKSMSLRTDFQTLYHSMKNMNKSKYMIIPTQRQLRSHFLPVSQTKNVLFSQFLPFTEGQQNKIDKAFLSSRAISNTKDEFSEIVSICGIEDNIIILPSKQKPKKIGLIGSDGEIYYYLVKNEKRGDLRKDMRLMELAQLINERMSINFKDLSLKTFSVIPLSEVTGIIEWVPNVTTLGSIVMTEWKELLGNSKFHRQLMETQDILRHNSIYPEKLYKIYCEEILPKYPPILHNWFFKKFSTKSSYNWLSAKQKYTRSTAAWSMFGYIVGLGDRHAENILIDTSSGDIVHVDFDCLFGKGFLLEVPEIVPFRLTPNIVIAMGSCGVEGTFTGACISAMNIFRSPFNKSFIMTFLEAFIHDPLIEWMRPGKTSQIANIGGGVDPISFIAAAKGHSHLRTIHRKLNGMVDCSPQIGKKAGEMCKVNGSQRRSLHERGLGLSVESQVHELINSAKCKRNLSQMYVGWMPQL